MNLWSHILLFLANRKFFLFCITAAILVTIFQMIPVCYVSRYKRTLAPTSMKHYDILVNSYMRSGSSFLGRLLTQHVNSFYWYEPLWNYDSGVYYWGPKLICVGKAICGLAKNTTRHNISMVLNTFDNIYNCKLRHLSTAVSEEILNYQSGKSWKSLKMCQSKNSVSNCLREMESDCKSADHRATKSVRLTLDNAGKILARNPRVKLVHLIRDPRAIMNSRITTKWFGINENGYNSYKLLSADSTDLCNRVLHDLRTSVKLKEKFPERFVLVLFEDLVVDRVQKSRILSKYFGIHENKVRVPNKNKKVEGVKQTENVVQEVHTMKKSSNKYRNKDNYGDWWRLQMSFAAMKVVDKSCYKVLRLLRYRLFQDENDLRNLTISGLQLMPSVNIQNIFTTKHYGFIV